MKCIFCQREISEDSKFCEYCGTKVEAELPIKSENSPEINEVTENLIEKVETVKTEEDLKIEKSIDKRIYKWKEKLIDLTKRNRLLSFKTSKYSTLRIIDEQPPEVYRSLVQNMQIMEFLPVNVNEEDVPEEEKKSLEELNEGIEFRAQEFKEYEVEELDKKHIDKFLQTKLSMQELTKTLNKISTTAKSTNDDLGYNVLFLALGSVIWYESDNSDERMEAPVILVPVEIKRKSIGQPYTIKYNEDSVILNPALTLKLKRDFGINLEDIVLDEDVINPVEVFSKVQEKIKDKSRWKLLNNIYIGLFSFAKFVMYKDLDEYQELIKSSKLIGTICGLNNEKQVSTDSICPMSELDNRVQPQSTYQILDADSSQQQAIQVVKSGNNLVIEGPPGTGKSQTIANIIAELLSQNKKVLFVSQKIAALDVVKSRLDINGLAPYCLELHSNKTNKKRVLDELINTLEYNFIGNYDAGSLSKLSDDIKTLKMYSKELHTPMGALQYSPFKALGIVLDNNQIPDLRYIFNDYDKWTKEQLVTNKALFTNAKEILKKLGNPKDFAWYGAEIRELEYEEKTQLKDKIDSFIDNIDNLESCIKNLTSEISLKQVTKPHHIKTLLTFADIILNVPPTAIPTIAYDDTKLADDIKTVCNNVKQFNLFNNRIKNKYNLGILNEDLDNLIFKFGLYRDKFFSRISFKYYKDCKYIRQYFSNTYRPNLDELVNDFQNLKELNSSIAKLEECNNIATKLYDKVWDKSNPDESIIQTKSNYLLKFKELVKTGKYFTRNILDKIDSQGIDYEKVRQLIAEINKLQTNVKNDFNSISNILKFNCNKAFSTDYSNVEFKQLRNKFEAISEKADDLTLWFKYLQSIDAIETAHLKEFWDKCVENNVSLDNYDTAFETQFLRVWLNGYVLKNNNILKAFNSLDQDDLVKEFKYLDKNQINSAKERLLTVLSSNTLLAKNEYTKEATELKRQGKLQRIRKSLRQIIRSIPNLFLSLKPCLMMSPSTVAQLLDPEVFHFDVVIFDEASQLTTEDCIGSVIRGDRLVVAGDTKQLPPTSFFKTVVEEDENGNEDEDNIDEYERTDLDSILDECTTSGFPQCMLKWHYRSKHEYLIAFSNKHLYQELYTFPSCVEDSETLGIKFLYNQPLDTTKENKRLEEAQIVARAVMQHAKKHPDMSLGVATLNIKQKGLIEAEIEKLREEDPSCEDFFNNSNPEYFFVKNLESIQGDERDVIMISVGYFKNQNGVLPMNFGPINKDGGERRLNVLITRARYMVEVFSGIKASDFNMDKSKSRGVQLLQWYLDFAERGEAALKQTTEAGYDDCFDSPFEEAVCKALRDKGYSVKTQVGCSGYKIDLAIRDKDNPGQFLLGIECDGAAYHSCATARDRDRLRQEVLEKLGWKIYRIWSTDWFKNPQKQLDKLVHYINSISGNKELVSSSNEITE